MTTMIFADSPVVGSLLAHIRYGDTAARSAAVKYAALTGTEALPALGRVYAGSDLAAGKAALEAMKKIAYNAGRPGADAEASAASGHLLALTGSEYPRRVRADALELLGIVGGGNEVSGIAALLDDKDVGEDARMALQRIPGKPAEDALKSAARGASAEKRAAIDLSLRQRKLKRADVGVKK